MTLGVLIHLLPELILLAGACVVLIVGVTASSSARHAAPTATLATLLAALAATLWLGTPTDGAMIPGLWLTSLTFFVRTITLVIGALIVLVNWHQPAAEERGEYMALILFSLLGVLLTASANDLIVLFFAIELVSIPTYVLIALSRTDARASESAVKYFFLGAMSAAILAYGLSFLYGGTGTTTIYSFATGSPVSALTFALDSRGPALIGMLLVFSGLAFKIAAVPLHVYVADVYEGAASPVTGMLGFVPKLAGFVALIKLFGACQWNLPEEVFWLLWIVAAATMTTGNVLALLQHNVKRILAYSSIAHTGYMMIALLIGPVAGRGPLHDGVAALLFYITIYGAMNLGTFALLTAFRKGDREVETLDDLAGLSARSPWSALALAVCVFSLMGFPPTAGLLGKLFVFISAFSLDGAHPHHRAMLILVVIGVVNAAIGAVYYLRVIAAAYVPEGGDDTIAFGGRPVRWGLALCSGAMLVIFAWPTPLVDSARQATVTLRNSIEADRVARQTGSFDIHPVTAVESDTEGYRVGSTR